MEASEDRMRALVIGASGFAGSAIVKRLLDEGHEVRGLVRRKDAILPQGVEVWPGTIENPNSIAEAARGCQAIFVAVAPRPHEEKSKLRWVHVAGIENTIAAARWAKVERIILISCADVVLSDEARVHWDERRSLPKPPIGARAQAIQLGEEIALAHSDDQVGITALRPAWLWGPGDWKGVEQLRKEAKSGGIDLCGSGRNLVATTYIEHLAEAALCAWRSPKAPGNAYYIADSDFVELREFLGQMAQALRLPPPRPRLSYRIRKLVAALGWGRLPFEEVVRRGQATRFDIQKAIQDLRFEPFVPMEEGMRRLGEWYSRQAHSFDDR
ncbi:MAG: NAD(P)H-binding protein [Sandaracinaceae bacterium]|nr:NAD(P)H-binding protein [Sandaracinaceae bacterium]